MKPEINALIANLAETRALLQKHGDKWISARLEDLETCLIQGDWTAIQSAVIEATGGMGSLRDRQLSVANGDLITRDEQPRVNARLDSLITQVEKSARIAAAAVGIQLAV